MPSYFLGLTLINFLFIVYVFLLFFFILVICSLRLKITTMTFIRKIAPNCTKEVGGTGVVMVQIRMGSIMADSTLLDMWATVSVVNHFEDYCIH